jgi:hypothetical protein
MAADPKGEFCGPLILTYAIIKAGSKYGSALPQSERIREGKEVTTMTGNGWEMFGTGASLLIVALVSAILFVYIWLRSHDVMHMTHSHVDEMAGDEGED